MPNDASLIGSTIRIVADAKWQICKSSCKNEKALLTLELPVAAQSEGNPETKESFAKARASQAKTTDLTIITAGNYGGKLGQFHYRLLDLLP